MPTAWIANARYRAKPILRILGWSYLAHGGARAVNLGKWRSERGDPLEKPRPSPSFKGCFLMRIAPNAFLLWLSCLISAQALAQAPPSISLIDFLVDGRNYLGKRITITGCQFTFAAADSITCVAYKITDQFNSQGEVMVDSQSLERGSLRRALHNCFDFNTRPECAGDITGMVVDIFTDLGVNNYPILGIKNATIKWSMP